MPKNNLGHRLEGYEFCKDKKSDKVYWVDHFTYDKSDPSNIQMVLGELLISFDRKKYSISGATIHGSSLQNKRHYSIKKTHIGQTSSTAAMARSRQ